MSTYYNFQLVDLNEFKSPPMEDGFYNFHCYETIEEVSTYEIEYTTNNYGACEVIDCLFEANLIAPSERDKYILFFRNLFWFNKAYVKQGALFLKDAWKLSDINMRCDFCSINISSLKKIVSLEKDIDFSLILTFMESDAYINRNEKGYDQSFNKFFRVTQAWLELYKLGIIKNKGVVYDVG
jgi:hypothetical protein